MTTKLDELFNLPPAGDEFLAEELVENNPVQIIQVNTSMNERVTDALRYVNTIDESDLELDDIAKKALATYSDLCMLGGSIQDSQAGKIYEAAAQMLSIALDARNHKANRKLRTIDLQLRKLKIDYTYTPGAPGMSGNNGVEFDRNELLKFIRDK